MIANRIARMMVACDTEKDLANAFGGLWLEAELCGKFSDYDNTNIIHYENWMISTWSNNNEISFLDNETDTCIIFTKATDSHFGLEFKYTDALPKWVKIEF